MTGATSGKLENMKQLWVKNFATPLEKKDLEPNVSSQIDEATDVTQKMQIPVRGTFRVWRGGNLKNGVRKWSGLVLFIAQV
jgi:hypothetical protein